MLLQRSGPVLMGVAWLDEPCDQTACDIVRRYQWSRPEGRGLWAEKWSVSLDLSHDEDALFGSLKKDTRNEVRRARDKDAVTCEELVPDADARRAFKSFYDTFAAQAGVPGADGPFLDRCAEAGILDVSVARAPEGEALVYHAHLLVAGQARLLHSASQFRSAADSAQRNLVGRANRLLHWADIVRFRARGIERYDFGGWDPAPKGPGEAGINRFKEEFGGQVVRQYNGLTPITLRGKGAMQLRALVGKPMKP